MDVPRTVRRPLPGGCAAPEIIAPDTAPAWSSATVAAIVNAMGIAVVVIAVIVIAAGGGIATVTDGRRAMSPTATGC